MPPVIPIYDVPTAQNSILRRQPWDEFSVPDLCWTRNAALLWRAHRAGRGRAPYSGRCAGIGAMRPSGADWPDIDRVEPGDLQVTAGDIDAAYAQVDPAVVDALHLAAARIEAFHRRQPAISWIHNDGDGTLGQLVRPIERVGIYVPGGTAPLPSTLLMTAIPAKVAGVPHISVITPPQRETGLPHPTTGGRGHRGGGCGLRGRGRAGHRRPGLWHGQSSPPWTRSAGRAICSPSWPSARSSAWWASTVCPAPRRQWSSPTTARTPSWPPPTCWPRPSTTFWPAPSCSPPAGPWPKRCRRRWRRQLEELDRAEIVAASLANAGGHRRHRGSAPSLRPRQRLRAGASLPAGGESLAIIWRAVQNAGGVFLGERSFEVLGDYVAGPSHVMPTGGTARFASPVNVQRLCQAHQRHRPQRDRPPVHRPRRPHPGPGRGVDGPRGRGGAEIERGVVIG